MLGIELNRTGLVSQRNNAYSRIVAGLRDDVALGCLAPTLAPEYGSPEFYRAVVILS